jgi:hypothetical protein
MSDKQSQKAGDNAQQVQAQTVVINNNNGVDEKRVREIFQELLPQAIEANTRDAEKTACLRIAEFESVLIARLKAMEDDWAAFTDPSFQLLLVTAQKAAASTERQADYKLLAEMLAQRTQVGEDRMSRTAIRGAVGIVSEVSDEALLGLTIICYLPKILDLTMEHIPVAMERWNNRVGQLLYCPLPQGEDWLDHLYILRAMRVGGAGYLKKIEEVIPSVVPGYMDVGILKDSENHQEAKKILMREGLPLDILVEHDLNKDYLRVNLPHRDMIDEVRLGTSPDGSMYCLTNPQRNAIGSLYDLYVQDESLRRENISKFIKEWDEWPNLRALRLWWNAVKGYTGVTSVGIVLAHANAERIGLTKTHEPSA